MGVNSSKVLSIELLHQKNHSRNYLPPYPNLKNKSLVQLRGVRIVDISAKIDNCPTQIEEKPNVMIYRTPHFRASVTLRLPPMGPEHHIQLGWVQGCTRMEFINTYGDEGCTSWEFPELNSGKFPMISDSDGKEYPWYGYKHEVATLKGPHKCEKELTVTMTDNFFPHITWCIPTQDVKVPQLTNVRRKQKFYAWLVLKDVRSGRYFVLKTVKWKMELQVTVSPHNPIGSRAKVVQPIYQKQPEILKHNIMIPNCVLRGPNANSAQALIWRPRDGESQVVVKPIESVVDIWNDYLLVKKPLQKTRS